MTNNDLYRHWLLRAYIEATNSPDPSSQNGSGVYVLGKPEPYPFDIPEESGGDGSVWTFAGSGFNKPCGSYDKKRYAEDRDYRLSVTVHAEEAGVLNAAKNGFCTHNAVLVCPWSACGRCAITIGESGIKTLIRHKQAIDFQTKTRAERGYPQWNPRETGDPILHDYDVSIIEFDGIVGGPLVRNSGTEFQP